MTKYVIEVVARQIPALAGSAGCAYTSPPQTLDDALRLARILLGLPRFPNGERWCRPIAGGQRTVTLRRIA